MNKNEIFINPFIAATAARKLKLLQLCIINIYKFVTNRFSAFTFKIKLTIHL